MVKLKILTLGKDTDKKDEKHTDPVRTVRGVTTSL